MLGNSFVIYAAAVAAYVCTALVVMFISNEIKIK